MHKNRRIWVCKQCSGLYDDVKDFAVHLRTHLTGQRSRIFRNAERKLAEERKKSKSKTLFQKDASFFKFDNITNDQLEISQPNSIFNMMNVNFETREMCKQLVDPSLVMPSKNNVEEVQEFNYADMLNLNHTEKEKEKIQSDDQTAVRKTNKLHSITKDLNLESPIKEYSNLELESVNKECATITPLNLYYIDEPNYISSMVNNGVAVKHNSNGDKTNVPNSNLVLVDNSVDQTVKSMNFQQNMVSGDPIQIIQLSQSNGNVQNGDYECEICSKVFRLATYLYRHLVKHMETFVCEHCDKEFARKDTWLAHSCPLGNLDKATKSKTNAEEWRQDISSVCYTTTSVDNTLASKIPNISNFSKRIALEASCEEVLPAVKKIYRCEICDVTIKDKSGLNKHMITHTEVCYTCVYCDTTVKHRHSMRRHLQRNHREYEHEWNNPDFISILQTDTKREAKRSKPTTKKKKQRSKKAKDQDDGKVPTLSPKRDRLIGTLSDELKIRFETNSASKTKISDYLNCETSVNSVKDDSSDLLSFTKHFDDDIAHTSFQALTLPDVTCKSFTGSDIVKVDSKDGHKSFNISPVMLLNKNSKRSHENLMDISLDKSSSLDLDKIQRFFSTPIKDKCVFFESPAKQSTDGKVMPSMPILFCEDEPAETIEKDKKGVVLPPKPPPEEDPAPPSYLMEEHTSNTMQLMDTSTDFTFFVLS